MLLQPFPSRAGPAGQKGIGSTMHRATAIERYREPQCLSITIVLARISGDRTGARQPGAATVDGAFRFGDFLRSIRGYPSSADAALIPWLGQANPSAGSAVIAIGSRKTVRQRWSFHRLARH